MRVPVSWLAERLELPAYDDGISLADRFADAFVRVGIEIEEVTALGEVTGPIVVGRVVEVEDLTGFKKPIRYCQVQVGSDNTADHSANQTADNAVRGIVCG
ncbi:MAG TPA: phenylalanine--tRNA ligase subunit beta, partial [Pseudonocardiaceae bacterium]|nr:phenylalanine--tRNA ligase subunit beta [Pseudonocardiaceae bacterium]